MKAYVVQLPNSNTNKTSLYRVTECNSWLDYINGDSFTYEYDSYPTYEAAQSACDALNKAGK